MTERETIRFLEKLNKLGFASITDEVKMNIKAGNSNFIVTHSNKINDDSLLYVLQFKKHENKMKLAGYGLTMQSIVIPKITSGGINTKELEARMVKADDLYNSYYSAGKGITENENKIIKSGDRKSTRLNSSHIQKSRMPSSA